MALLASSVALASQRPGNDAPPELELRGFSRLDALAREPTASGVYAVVGPAPALRAAASHVLRRARGSGRAIVHVPAVSAEPFRDLLERLGLEPPSDPEEAALAISHAAGAALVVVSRARASRWGRAVEQALARRQPATGGALLLVLGEGDGDEGATSLRARSEERVVRLERSLSTAARQLFWEAVALDAVRELAPLHTLEQLEAAWRRAAAVPEDGTAPEGPRVPEPLARAVHALSVAGGALPAHLLAAHFSGQEGDAPRTLRSPGSRREGAEGARRPTSGRVVEELREAGLVETRDGVVRLCVDAGTAPAPGWDGDARLVAEHLAGLGDPWARMRAAELFSELGDLSSAEAACTSAIADVVDPDARADFWNRWEASAAGAPVDGERALRLAEFATRVGDVDRALGFARSAVGARPDDPAAILALGRATAQRGDLTGAFAVLGKALERAEAGARGGETLPWRARAAVEMAELSYLAGDLGRAKELAETGLRAASDDRTRLEARNVLGKLLLAAGEWDAADRHFAEDAVEAGCGADLEAELRARLNRAIALLSSGRREDARLMLEAVREDGERRKELRAVSFALANLATIAILQHQYGDALRLSESAIDVRRRIGERVGLARLVTNLAALRLRLGLVAEAEQALLFGRQVCGPSMPGIRTSHFALVTARLHLERGATVEAGSELDRAIGAASSASDGAKLSECHRLSARVALEDGDLPKARRAIDEARAQPSTPDAQAELVMLEALLARASGAPARDLAESALEQARRVEDEELEREAHVLAHQLALDGGDLEAAAEHLASAVSLRERVLRGLPPDLRANFLSRRDMAQLARLEVAASAADEPSSRGGPPSLEPAPSLRPARTGRTLVGRHPSLAALLHAVQRVGPTDTTVLVLGESGTGKELVAEAIHEASHRRAGPLVKVNCAALVETLLLSELFGHERGAFTGATGRRRGRFEMAEGGTLFLDEIGDISPRTQVALLRVLQERTFERVGGTSPIRANVRVVAATHRDLRAMVARGEFREDLYYRLRQVELGVPSLRSRASDVPLIANELLTVISREQGIPARRLSEGALRVLAAHAWPGNVRELENVLRSAAVFSETDEITAEDLAQRLPGAAPAAAASAPAQACATLEARTNPTDVAYAHIRGGVSLHDMKRQIERECVARALTETSGNITRAAGLLGMKRPRLSQLVKQYGMSASADGDVDAGEE